MSKVNDFFPHKGNFVCLQRRRPLGRLSKASSVTKSLNKAALWHRLEIKARGRKQRDVLTRGAHRVAFDKMAEMEGSGVNQRT